MGRLLRYLVYLIVLAGLGGLVYLWFFDLPPPTGTIETDISDAIAPQ